MNFKKTMAPVGAMFLGNVMILGGACLVAGIITAPFGLVLIIQGTKMCWTAIRAVVGKGAPASSPNPPQNP